ncbi:hypothetical protein AB205_0201220, partial [Aquarana catesbeiana]
MEEFSEGHKDMMETPNTRNPPERCPRPLYSRDSTQEDHTIPHHHQSGNLRDSKVEVKEQIKEEDDGYAGGTNAQTNRESKSGDPIDIEFEVKEEEERYVRDDQQSMEEDGITGTFIEEDTPTEIST